jgi:hypothetical protein
MENPLMVAHFDENNPFFHEIIPSLAGLFAGHVQLLNSTTALSHVQF